MENNGEKKKSNSKRIILIVVNVILALVLIGLILGAAYVENLLGLINRVDPEDNTTMSQEEADAYESSINAELGLNTEPSQETDETEETVEITWATVPPFVPKELEEEIINILLIGQDARGNEKVARSDAMILCTINTKYKTVVLTSFMRDMCVQIPGYKDNRINASYAFGGMKLLNKTLEKNFGITVDGNIEVNFDGFMSVIDMMGGVEISLTQAEAEYLNRRGNWDLSKNDNWSLVEGPNLLTGSQALAYSRIRQVATEEGVYADFGRTYRQRKVLNALVEKAKGLTIGQLDVLLLRALPLLTTDMTNAEILDLAAKLLPLVTDMQISTLRIPADGTYKDANVRGMAVLLPDLAKNRKLLEDAMVGQKIQPAE